MHVRIDQLARDDVDHQIVVPGRPQRELLPAERRSDAYEARLLALREHAIVVVDDHEPPVAREPPRLHDRLGDVGPVATLDRVRVQPGHVHDATLQVRRNPRRAQYRPPRTGAELARTAAVTTTAQRHVGRDGTCTADTHLARPNRPTE